MLLAASVDPRFASKRQKTQSYSLPAPVGGLNFRDAYTDMAVEDAVILTNVFPEASYLTVRGGFAEVSVGLLAPIRSLMTWNGGTGVDKLFAGAGSKIWDVNSITATAVVTGLASVDFQWTNMETAGGMFLALVNGADDYQTYDGTTWDTPVISGATSSTFINIAQFKERLWFAVKDSLDIYYLGLQSIAGAATVFPLGSVFRRGGYVQGLGSFSTDAGDGPDDFLCFVSNNGEVLVYQGTNPDSADTWAIVGRFDVGMPIGRRCTVRMNGDLGIITQDGVISMRSAMRFGRESIQKAAITGKIQTLFSQYAQQYKDNFGWSPCLYPKCRYLIVNIPTVANRTQVQLVMNTITGAWCQFEGMNGGCWGVSNDNLYFGGINGRVYQANVGFLDNTTDNIAWEVQTSWQKLGGSTNKFFTLIQPTMTVGPGVAFGVTINVDFFSVAPPISLAAISSSTPSMVWSWTWPGIWGGQNLLDHRWQSCGAIGTWSSVHMTGTVTDGACQINDFELTAERGGILS